MHLILRIFNFEISKANSGVGSLAEDAFWKALLGTFSELKILIFFKKILKISRKKIEIMAIWVEARELKFRMNLLC
jgi:hypothetical protein